MFVPNNGSTFLNNAAVMNKTGTKFKRERG